MTVTDVRLVDAQTREQRDGTRVHVLTWEVDSNDKDDHGFTITNAPGLPDRGAFYSLGNDLDLGALLKEKEARRINTKNDFTTWRVTGTYDSKFDFDEEQPASPLDMRAEWSGSFVQFSKNYYKDKDGTAITNSAGEYAPILGDDSRLSIVVARNLPALNVLLWAEFRDAVNSSAFWGVAARKIKVQSITWRQQYHESLPYYGVRWEFHVSDTEWDLTQPDAGFHAKDGNNWNRIFTADGFPTSVIHPLTTAGAEQTNSSIASLKTHRVYPEKDFSQLDVPNVLGARF